ncbi:CocE/NonD family hydrolase, partial [Streptomyces sp. OF3]
WARHGFAAVAQDVRGRHDSDGDWRPYTTEDRDGTATARWIRRRPWSDGRIVAAGGSYAAYCALTLALDAPGDARPDAVLAAVPVLGPAETAREPDGCERLYDRVGWWTAHGGRRVGDPSALADALTADPQLLDHLPVSDLPRRLGRPLPGWTALWEAPYGRLLDRAADATTPLLAVGGTHDTFTAETERLWSRWGGPTARLLIGPWGHGLTAQPGPDADPAHRLPLGPLYARWARAALADTLTPGHRGVVALGGSPLWLTTDSTAPGHALPLGGATGLRLLGGPRFTADPRRPVRSDELAVAPEPSDRALAATGPLPRPLDLFGPAEVRLRARSATPSADWVARLVAVDPAGHAAPLATGIVRRHHPPGGDAEFTVPLGRLARRLAAGTRLRLEIAGHHFPAHARNPHTGQDPLTATEQPPSERELIPEGSALLLPRLERGAFTASVDPVQEICR